jgi:hypothetical protein
MGNELGTWEHVGEQIGNLGNILGRDLISWRTLWKLDGSTLGTKGKNI